MLLFGIIFAFFGLHLTYINTPFVNYEWVYRTGSQYFLTHNPALLEQYFSIQVNPLTYSLFSKFRLTYFSVFLLYYFQLYNFITAIAS